MPEWFGISEARENYILESENQLFFKATIDNKVVGFLCLKETGKDTVELAVIGVLKEYQHQGIGRQLFEQAKKAFYISIL